ncbi:MAG: metal ABC transporter substrate-binding protein [Saccharofermentans sp.]|nr:metal ABC transporter substrate-binding protein [Saccharofermentans sp.]
MKRILSILTAAVLAAASFCGCSTADKPAGTGKLQIVTTIFPEYDWVNNILGSNPANAEVTLLADNGTDLHSFQPTASDILKISSCDLFIYVGGESDEWVEDVLKEAVNKDMVVIDLLDELGDSVKEEETVEGMQPEEGEDEEEETEYDEHVWLSVKNAINLVGSIENAVSTVDPANAGSYKSNADAYINNLKDLDAEYQSVVKNASVKTLLFGDRFPFRYLTDDYGLDYYAAFAGCSAESEASFETITFLSKKADELSLPAVITIEGSDKRIAKTIVENTDSKDQQIISLDSMQSVTSQDVKDGATYISVMSENLEVLKTALGY